MHLMIDFETLSLKPNAVILQFAAVAFNPDTQEIVDVFFANVDTRVQPGRDVSADTVLWWLDQSDSARRTVLDAAAATARVESDEFDILTEEQQIALVNSSAVPINHVAQAFIGWIDHLNSPENEVNKTHGCVTDVWSNGAIDHAWLDNMLEYCGFKNPLPYYLQRDYRTLRALFPEVQAPEFVGTPHNANDDALHQTKHLLEILSYIRSLQQGETVIHNPQVEPADRPE